MVSIDRIIRAYNAEGSIEFPGNYLASITISESFLGRGEFEDSGFEYEDVPFDSLDELLVWAKRQHSWKKWSHPIPSGKDYVISGKETEYRTGNVTTHNLYMQRINGTKLNAKEIHFVSETLRLH